MTHWIRIALLAALLPATAFAAEPPKNAALHAYFERIFQEEMKGNPELATLLGMEGDNARLNDRTPAAIARRKARNTARLAELKRFDAKRLNTQDRLSRDVALDLLEQNEALNALYGKLPFGADGGDSWQVAAPLGGIQEWFAALSKATPFRHAQDYENYLKRLEALPASVDVLAARLREGMRTGWTPPRAVMGKVPEKYDAFAKGPVDEALLFAPFKQFPSGVDEPTRARLEAAGRKVIAERVMPAFASFQRFLKDEYIPACRTSLGSSTLPGGMRYYEHAVQVGTTANLTPREIHDIGLKEVARIRAEMDKVIASTGFKGTFPEFLAFLRTDKQFYHANGEELLRSYRDLAKRADAELPKFFAELPRLPYGIRPMEAFEGDNFEHYSPGAIDGSRAGFFEANANDVSKRPKYDMEATLLHEAVPGHHLQIARAQELKDLPTFRRAIGYTAFQEGWALYAESLGPEMGFYKDPYSRFGALSAEMLRACRLVLDTGLHAFGWTREQSIKYLAENSGINEATSEGEIDRYIYWPGQALGYKIGELKIKELRARSERTLGKRFDLRRFHNAIIDNGPLPLGMLEAQIDQWIAGEKAAKPKPRAS